MMVALVADTGSGKVLLQRNRIFRRECCRPTRVVQTPLPDRCY